MNLILRAKHWQIFIVVFFIPSLLIVVGLLCYNFYGSLTSLFYMIPTGLALSQIVIYAWLWIVGKTISDNVEGQKLFKTLIKIPCFVILLILFFWLFLTLRISFGFFSTANILFASLFVILPVQFVFVVSLIYCFYFVARSLKQFETKQKPKFEEFFKEFILILIFPVGIWFLQPRINRILLEFRV